MGLYGIYSLWETVATSVWCEGAVHGPAMSQPAVPAAASLGIPRCLAAGGRLLQWPVFVALPAGLDLGVIIKTKASLQWNNSHHHAL